MIARRLRVRADAVLERLQEYSHQRRTGWDGTKPTMDRIERHHGGTGNKMGTILAVMTRQIEGSTGTVNNERKQPRLPGPSHPNDTKRQHFAWKTGDVDNDDMKTKQKNDLVDMLGIYVGKWYNAERTS